MGREWMYLAGGLLSGASQHLIDEGKAKREARLREMEMRHDRDMAGLNNQYAMQRQESQQQFTAGQNAEDRTFRARQAAEGREHDRSMVGVRTEAQRGLLPSTLKDQVVQPDGTTLNVMGDGTMTPATINGEVVRQKPPKPPGEMNDAQALEQAREAATAEDAVGEKKVDHTRMAQLLREWGYADLARGVETGMQPVPEPTKEPGMLDKAWDWAFGEDGAEAGGDVATPRAEPPTPGAPPQLKPLSVGRGTAEDPYRPTSQAQFDRLPKGAVFINPGDGKPYVKE